MNRADRILKAAQLLRESIPPPYKAPPKPKHSWQGLKVGDKLVHLLENTSGTVTACNSQGIDIDTGYGITLYWTDKDWKRHWKRTPKRRKQRVKAESKEPSG